MMDAGRDLGLWVSPDPPSAQVQYIFFGLVNEHLLFLILQRSVSSIVMLYREGQDNTTL